MACSRIRSCVKKTSGYTEDGECTKVNSFYSALGVQIYGRHWGGQGRFKEWIVSLMKHLKMSGEGTVCAVVVRGEHRLFTTKFHALEHLCEI